MRWKFLKESRNVMGHCHKMKLGAKFLVAFLVFSAINGCTAPRTGVYFQSTKSDGNDNIWGGLAYIGIMELPFVLPTIICLPSAWIGYTLDHYVLSPVYDVVNLPYDYYLRSTGPYIKVVDTRGRPIPQAQVNAPIATGIGSFNFSGETDGRGLFYIPLSWRSSSLGRGEVKADGFVTTPMDSPRWLRHNSRGTSWQQTKDGAVLHEVVMLRNGEVLAPVVKSVVLDTDRCGIHDLDIVEGDWCPPDGNGKIRDLRFQFEYGCELPDQPGRGMNNSLAMSLAVGDLRRGVGIVELKEPLGESMDLATIIGTNRTNIARIGLFDQIGRKPAIACIKDTGKKQWAFHTDIQYGVYGVIRYLDCWGDSNSSKRTIVLQYVYNPMLDYSDLTPSKDIKFPPPPKLPPKLEYKSY